jgi:release factor glutamine methyltransferase
MFSDNSIKGVHQYFQDKLASIYDAREIRNMVNLILEVKFGLSKTDQILGERRFSESELLQFRTIRKGLENHVPVQYILGVADFCGMEFEVSSSVLIPRPETEELVHLITENHTTGKLLDIGTGSGAIAISLKKLNPDLQVSAIDVSEGALKIAKKNATNQEVEIHFQLMDVLNEMIEDNYDIIVSNPPYIPLKDQAEMRKNVLHFEPEIALFVEDESPLKFYIRIADVAQRKLNSGGTLYFEIHESFAREVEEMLNTTQFHNIQVFQDLQGKDRMIRAQKKP